MQIIHVSIPQSFVDEMNLNVVDLAESMSLAYKGKNLSFQVDLLPDEFFNSSIIWLNSK